MLRSLYYAIPARLRYLARRLYYLPKDIVSPLPGLSPPRGLIFTGGSGDEFARQGREFRDFLFEYGGLDPDSRVLDIGSGIGRLAIPLTDVLSGGSYEGFDVVELGVRWCQRNIGTRFPNFSFRYFDLENDLYKASGEAASGFTFPYADGAFSLALATSVFTHMLPGEVARYVHETARVLEVGGVFVATAFVLDGDSRAAMGVGGGFNFRHNRGNYALLDPKVQAANVAYGRAWLEELIASAGLRIEREFRGRWSGLAGGHAVAFQDVLVLAKR